MSSVCRRLLIVLSAAVLALTGCGGGSGAASTPKADPSPYTGSTSLADWTTYHHDAGRSGVVDAGPSGDLQVGWTSALKGDVYGEPLVVGDLLVVATEEDQLYGLDARTGHVRWHTALGTAQPQSGLPCGNIDPLGVTGTPAYDASTGSVFVAAETEGGHHTLWALDPTDGSKRWHRTLDTQPDRNIKAEQERGALLISHGRVITVFGGLAGDCDDYVGYAASVPTDDKGATTSYAVPTKREAGMWATPGAVAGPDGSVLVASGNGAEVGGTWDGSDSVIQLDPTTMKRRSVFAPSTWPEDNRQDLDLGSMSPAVVREQDRVVIAGKRGEVYLLETPLGGVGSELASTDGCHAYGGSAVVGSTVLMPCLKEGAVRALSVGKSRSRGPGARRTCTAPPSSPGTASTSPTVTPVTWWCSRSGPASSCGTERLVRSRTSRPRWSPVTGSSCRPSTGSRPSGGSRSDTRPSHFRLGHRAVVELAPAGLQRRQRRGDGSTPPRTPPARVTGRSPRSGSRSAGRRAGSATSSSRCSSR